ncbi:hypothetical protein FEM48_Zijuj10G0091900 [Ziziphus jujuba var. spinosa]|uniref:RPW8 domain-containing protein n=1 Tax=Ziziphus jujuba var. spinosa TaxID=714518 RepID=A0A978UMI4_ZIZJJ|nr:hypothetical protein FEM48_Zijuj10G0091900 [Ziziphus jujuba var. spinosa]
MEFGWAALGAGIGVLFDVVKETAAKNNMFKDALESLMRKLETLKPLIEEVKKLNEQLPDEHGDECGYYESYLKEGAEHVRKCETVGRCNIVKKSHYAHKLQELDRTIQLLILIGYVARNSKKILIFTGITLTVIQEQQGISIGQPHHPHQDIPSSPYNAVPPSPLLPTSQNHDVGQGWIARIREGVGSLLNEVKESNDETSLWWKTPLNKLKATLQILQLLVKDKEILDLLEYKAAYYKFTIDKGVEVVQKCSQVHGLKYLCMKPFYAVMLLRLNKVLEELVQELLDPAIKNTEKKLNSVREEYNKIRARQNHGRYRRQCQSTYQIPIGPDLLRR